MVRKGFSGTIAKFIELSNSNEIASIIRHQIAPKMRNDNNEFGSWQDGLLKLSNDLNICIRQQPMISNLHIILELVFDNQSRVDVVICGLGENGENVYLILELKQWSEGTIESSPNQGMLWAQVGGSRTDEVYHPLLQAQAYSNSLESNPVFTNSVFISGAYLPNMVPNSKIIFSLGNKSNNHLILNNQNEILLDLLNSNFLLTNSSTRALEIMLENEFTSTPNYDFLNNDYIVEEEDNQEIYIPEQKTGKYGYIGTKDEFIADCERNLIAHKIRNKLGIKMKETTSEFRSWREGLARLANILKEVIHDFEVACEVSSQAGMIDVILLGKGLEKTHIFVIEIKQWSEPGIKEAYDDEYIRAHVGGKSISLTLHPLVQAHLYLRGLMNYNMYFEDNSPKLKCVAFLPNVMNPDESSISDKRYSVHTGIMVYGNSYRDFVDLLNKSLVNFDIPGELKKMIKAPLGFTSSITKQIRNMIEDTNESLVPSGEQQRAIDKIVNSIEDSDCRQVHIIQGGPGTGKTIVGLLSMFRFYGTGKLFVFTAGNNPTPRVLSKRVQDITGNSDFNGIIMTGGKFKNFIKKNKIETLDLLLVDEAQSLKWGMGAPPKISEMIDKSKVVVFMLDERQSDDPREKVNIQSLQKEVIDARSRLGEEIRMVNHTLEIQQRAGKISNLLPWIGKLLGYDDQPIAPLNFPVTIYDSASNLQRAVLEQNSEDGVDGALTASYCWEFVSKDNDDVFDIKLDDGDFQARWNQQGGTGNIAFLIDKTRDERVGYPPELRGQELNHAGVILGPDLKIIEGELKIFPESQAPDSHCFKIAGRGKTPQDKSDYQRLKKVQYIDSNREKYVSLDRNQHWIILTRASQHLHLYSEDLEVRNYLKEYFEKARNYTHNS